MDRSTSLRIVRWTGGILLALAAVLILFASFGMNWLRGPIERMATEKTGREFRIGGNLSLRWAWPIPRVRAEKVTFANPGWASTPLMLEVEAAEATFDLKELLRRVIVLIEVRLDRPRVFLEEDEEGRRNWLLDREQRDEESRLAIGRLTLDEGLLAYRDAARDTGFEARISTRNARDNSKDAGVVFEAKGTYRGEPMTVAGSGGPVIAIRDRSTPYPVDVKGRFGSTEVSAKGSITSVVTLAGLNLDIALKGRSLSELLPLIGIALPASPPYTTAGRIVRARGYWRYEEFRGRVGGSDIAGTLQVDTGGARPFLHGEVHSRVLDIADLGPLIGAGRGPDAKKKGRAGVLPDAPFDTQRWDTVDADVRLRAGTIKREKELPLRAVSAHILMKDRVLRLDPVAFGLAGGQVAASLRMDGRKEAIRTEAKVRADRIKLSELVPAAAGKAGSRGGEGKEAGAQGRKPLPPESGGKGAAVAGDKVAIGNVSGALELAGSGNSIARMLGTANGKAGVVIAGGEISNFVMELVGIDLWEMLKFKGSGDQPVRIRCGIADFGIRNGVMQANALVLDTEDTIVTGRGHVDLRQERIDLVLLPEPKDRSFISLRTPLHIRGPLARPDVGPDKTRLALRAGGALALAAVNPLLAVIPLIETGPGLDSDCGKLIQQTKKLPQDVAKNVGDPKRPEAQQEARSEQEKARRGS